MTTHDPDQAGKTQGKPRSQRAANMQSPLDRAIYHPIAAWLARKLSHTSITPNMVSIAGGLMVVLAGIAYVQPGWPIPAVAGLLLHMSWHVFDGADGDLARLTGRTSSAGEIVDGACDYVGHVILYIVLALAAFPTVGWAVVWLVLAAGISRVVQASFYEAQRRQFLCWVHGVPWLRSVEQTALSPLLQAARRGYLNTIGWLVPEDKDIEVAVADPIRREKARAALLNIGSSAITGSILLGSGFRTIFLGASMLAGSPLWYFLYEAVILNAVLIWDVVRTRRNLEVVKAAI